MRSASVSTSSISTSTTSTTTNTIVARSSNAFSRSIVLDHAIRFRDDRFEELLNGYHRSRGYNRNETYVEMDKPRPCSYTKRSYPTKETVLMGEPIPRQKSPNGRALITPMAVEWRGITFHQLLAVKANTRERCTKEKWVSTKDGTTLLTPEKVTLYDINKYIIIPFTKESESSFVETLPSTAGTQPPKFFVSHTWGESFFHTLDCVCQMMKDFEINRGEFDDRRGAGMTDNTPIWICAFANNQHDLGNSITLNPSESGFAKATVVAKYRTLSILDKEGTVFSRIWCVLELYLTLMEVQNISTKVLAEGCDVLSVWNGLWAVYTVHEHTWNEGEVDEHVRRAVGIVSGGVPSDYGNAYITAEREGYFPMIRILKALNTIMVQNAVASIPVDKIHILNCISGNTDNFDAEPPKEHPKFDELNNAVKGELASSIPALRAASREGGDQWYNILTAMSKSVKKDVRSFNFNVGRGWDHLTTERAVEMISHLPPFISFRDWRL